MAAKVPISGSTGAVYFQGSASVARLSADKRHSARRRVLKSAIAAYNDRHCTIPCVVRDISATGARLRSDSSISVPDTFELIVELDGLEMQCEVVWRKLDELGVRFIGAPRRGEPRRYQVVDAVPSGPLPVRRKKRERGLD